MASARNARDAQQKDLTVKVMTGHHLATLPLLLKRMIQTRTLANQEHPELKASIRALDVNNLRLVILGMEAMALTELLIMQLTTTKCTISLRQLSIPGPQDCHGKFR